MMKTLLATAFAFGLLLATGPADPAPVGKMTFAEVEQKKDQLKDKIVRIELVANLGEGSKIEGGLVRYIAKDTSGSATPYGQVAYPPQTVKKVNDRLAKGPCAIYFRVHVFGGKAAALGEAVGTTFTGSGNKTKYSWE